MFKYLLPIHLLLCSIIAGCGGEKNVQSTPELREAAAQGTATQKPISDSSANTRNVKFDVKLKAGDGSTSYYLKFDGEDGKLLSGAKKELFRFKRNESKLKIVDANEKIVGYIAAYPGRFKIENSTKNELYQYQQSGSDWKLKKSEIMILRIKQREYGYEAETPNDERVSKVKYKDGKTSLRDADEKTVFYTKDKLDSIAMMPLGFTDLDIHHRFALSLALQIKLGQD